MDAILPALLLGLSIEGLVLCPIFTFGVSLSRRGAGLQFLTGRIVGITLLGAILGLGFLSAGLIGRLVPHKRLVDAASGVVLLGVGALYAWRAHDLLW